MESRAWLCDVKNSASVFLIIQDESEFWREVCSNNFVRKIVGPFCVFFLFCDNSLDTMYVCMYVNVLKCSAKSVNFNKVKPKEHASSSMINQRDITDKN